MRSVYLPGSQVAALEVVGATRRFGAATVVRGVHLAIPQGSVFGLVGPNGAGKTTLLSMAVGLLRPTAGTSRVLGHDVWSDGTTARSFLGVMPGEAALPERLTAAEALRHLGMLWGMDSAVLLQRAGRLLTALGLSEAADQVISEYSTGMKKKLGLAIALLHDPPVVVLDEPLESVDPLSALTITRIIARLAERGRTVIVSSHVMAVVERLCDRVGILVDGVLVASGPLDDVRAGATLEERLAVLVGTATELELSWL